MSSLTELPKKILERWTNRRPRPRVQGLVTALELDGSLIRVVTAQHSGSSFTILRVLAQRLELSPDADRSDVTVMGTALARTLSQLNVKPGPVIMGVPRNQVVLRTLTLPLLKDIRELASMVHFQVSKDLPFRMEDAVIDFKIRRRVDHTPPKAESGVKAEATESAPAPKLEVLVACLKRELVEFYQQLAASAGIQLVALGLLPYANVRCLEACHHELDDDAVALVSLRPDEINIDIIAEQALLFSRGSPTPSASEAAHPAEASESKPQENFETAATIEVIRTLHAYGGMDPTNPVRQVIVTGATGLEEKVAASLAQRLTAICRVLDVAAGLKLPKESMIPAAGAMGPIGLALGISDAQGLPFDFLNPKRPAVQRDVRRLRILAGTAAAAAVLVFVMGLRTYLVNQRNQTLKIVQAELSDAKSKQPIYRKLIQQTSSVEGWLKGERNWLEHVAYLSAVLPTSEEVYLTSIAVANQGVIRLAVQARSGEALAKLEKQLHSAGYTVKPIAITPGADRYGYEFRSNIELVVPEKMKIDLTKNRPAARPADDASLDPGVVRKAGGQG